MDPFLWQLFPLHQGTLPWGLEDRTPLRSSLPGTISTGNPTQDSALGLGSGGTLGGMIILRMGLTRALGWFGAAQMLSTLGFALLFYSGHNNAVLAVVVAVENFTGGLGTAAFVGFMGALTDKRFTATQYALLSSLMGVPRVLLSAPTGWLALTMGWPAFFVMCTLLAIPGLWLISRVASLAGTQPALPEPKR